MPAALKIVLIILVIAAAFSDLRTRRIPNWLTAPGAALGIALQIWYGGVEGAVLSLSGAALGFIAFMFLYIAGGMGAGDVKLFAAVGAFAGPRMLVVIFICTGLLGGIAAIVISLSRGRLEQTLERTRELLAGFGGLNWREVRRTSIAAPPDALRLPYGAVIAGGALLSLLVAS